MKNKLFCLMMILLLNGLMTLKVTAKTLDQVPGQVVNLPIAGFNIPWVVSNYHENGYTEIMAAKNVCGLAAVGCKNSAGNPVTNGTAWNSSNNAKAHVYDTQMNNIYTNLPENIGGVAKSTAIRNTTWDMDGFSIAGVRSNGYNAAVKMPVNLVSHYEWLKGQDTGTGNSIVASSEPADNSLGDLLCQAVLDTENCLDMSPTVPQQTKLFVFARENNYPWTRSAESAGTVQTDTRAWHLPNGSGSLAAHYVGSYSWGVLPVLWLKSDMIVNGIGTYDNPYELGLPAVSQNDLSLSALGATWDGSGQVLAVTGNVNYPETGKEISVWASVCNTVGECIQKNAVVISNGDDTAYSLTWTGAELASGTYSGTIWVGAHLVESPIGEDNDFAQSNGVNFAIASRIMDLTVVRGRAFELELGDAGIFNLATGTNQGVTVSVDGTTNQLTVAGTLAGDAAIPFGSAILKFTTLAVPESNLVETSLN